MDKNSVDYMKKRLSRHGGRRGRNIVKSIVKRFECAWEDEKDHEIVKANLRRYVEVTDYIKLLEPQQEKKIIQGQRELKKEENPFWTANPIYRNF